MHICLSTHCIALFPLRTPASWRSAKWTRRLFKVWINWPNSKLICYSERGQPKLSFEYKFVGHTWKLLNYTQPYMHICFSTHCIALFPLRTPASWRSAKWTRRLFGPSYPECHTCGKNAEWLQEPLASNCSRNVFINIPGLDERSLGKDTLLTGPRRLVHLLREIPLNWSTTEPDIFSLVQRAGFYGSTCNFLSSPPSLMSAN